MDEQEHQFFHRFTEPGADRYRLLWDFLSTSQLAPQPIKLADSQHILLCSPQGWGDKKSPRVLVAHYDCVPGSPGANDNGAAVLQLIMAAKEMYQRKTTNWFILFTGKEERKRGSAINSQGSYLVAQGFKSIGFEKAQVYIFDACGRGNTMIFSTALEQLSPQSLTPTMLERIRLTRNLRSHALDTARKLMIRRLHILPTPFSDDLGFISAGFAAQTITMLPEQEAQLLLNNPFRGKEYPHILTWDLMNSPQDRRETLTEDGFNIIPSFATALCEDNRV